MDRVGLDVVYDVGDTMPRRIRACRPGPRELLRHYLRPRAAGTSGEGICAKYRARS